MMLKDRVAIVTGGAQGIGRAIVDKLSAEGAAVAVADINGTGAAEAAAAQPNAIGLTVDVSDPAAVDAMVASTVERFGRLDILVNNAAIVPFTLG